MRPNWAEISRSALRHNVRVFRRHLAAAAPGRPPLICGVVKANAYGHGLIEVAQTLAAAGIPWLAVTSAEEGAALRAAGLTGRILVLGAFGRADAALIVRQRLTPTLWELGQLALLRQARHALPRGARLQPLPVHVKVDTGMGRLGVPAREAGGFLAAVRQEPSVVLEAVYSHFSSAEDHLRTSLEQLRVMRLVLQECDRLRPRPSPARKERARDPESGGFFWHMANSAAAWRLPASYGGMVRLGLGLYGYSPSAEAAKALRPVLSWKSRIIALRELPRGHHVGYGGAFITRRRSRIAVLATGYADGYPRCLGLAQPGKPAAAHVLVHGERVALAGRISMDLTSLDVTDIPGARVGDPAVLIGHQGGRHITADDLANWAGTIPYEILCGVNSRVPRLLRD